MTCVTPTRLSLCRPGSTPRSSPSDWATPRSHSLDVYSHSIPHLQKEAASEIASLVLGRFQKGT